MNRIFLQISGPAAVVGVVLFIASLAGLWSIHRLQKNLTTILADNVTSLEAAQRMEICLRQLRFHSFLDVMNSNPQRQALLEADHAGFEEALGIAKANISIQRESDLVRDIEDRYVVYLKELREGHRPQSANVADYVKWAEEHPLRALLKPCRELLTINKTMMDKTARESETVGRQMSLGILFLGILGPASGLVAGYGLARHWSRTIASLSVRLHGMHADMDKNLAALKIDFGKDWQTIDRQLDGVAERVKEIVLKLQQQQHDLLRSEQLAAVGQLAASVAHEIRNPLTAIKMLVAVALRSRPAQTLTDQDLHVIYEEIAKLERTVETLLDYAKPPQIHRQEADFAQIVNQALKLVEPRARQQSVTIRVRGIDAPILCHIDASQIGSVLVNLLINAIDALPEGGDIDVDVDAAAADAIRFTIADNGQGVSPEMQLKLFSPFASTKQTGTGLGLSICRRIVRDHGGSIELETDGMQRRGARFHVEIPASFTEASHAAASGRR